MANSTKPKGKIINALPAQIKNKIKKQILKDLTFEDLSTIGKILVNYYETDRIGFAKRACHFCKTWR
jgi:hypothetical protein